jgi:hypothetical protein
MSKKYVKLTLDLPVRLINLLEEEAKKNNTTIDTIINECLEKSLKNMEEESI